MSYAAVVTGTREARERLAFYRASATWDAARCAREVRNLKQKRGETSGAFTRRMLALYVVAAPVLAEAYRQETER